MSDILQKTIEDAKLTQAEPTPKGEPKPQRVPTQDSVLSQTLVDAGGTPGGPIRGEVDFEQTQLRNFNLSKMQDQSYQQQIDDKLRAVEFFVKTRPDLTREQIVQTLPALYESVTGQKHVDGRSMTDAIGDSWDTFWKSTEADDSYRRNDFLQQVGDALDFASSFVSPTSQVLQTAKQHTKNTFSQVDTQSKAEVAKLDSQVAKKTVTEGGQWWLGAVDSSTQLVGSLAYIGRESLVGGLAGGETGAAVAGWNASARMMSNSSFRRMREAGVDYQISDTASNVIGYGAASVEALGLGGIAAVALKPVINKAIQGSMPAIARALTANSIKMAQGTAIGTAEEVIQEGIAIAGENQAFKDQNTKNFGDKMARAMEAADLAGDIIEQNVLAALLDYNKSALIPLDKPEEIAKRLRDTAVSSAQGFLVLGGAGGMIGTARDAKTLGAWKKAGTLNQNIEAAGQSAKASAEIQKAKPVTDAPADGIPVFYTEAGHDLEGLATGVRLHTDVSTAEQAARDATTAPLDKSAFLAEIDRVHPALSEIVREVIAKGPDAVKAQLEAEDGPVQAWEKQNNGFHASDIVELADHIRTGQQMAGRNQLAQFYTLTKAIPETQIIEGRIDPASAVVATSRDQVDQAFKDGAKAVQFAGSWYIRDSKSVAVTGKSQSMATVTAMNPATDVTYQANGNTVLAVRSDGTEVGRLTHEQGPNGVQIQDVQVPAEFRRQGVAKALVQKLREANVGKQVGFAGPLTKEGEALQQSIRESSPAFEKYGPLLESAQTWGNDQEAEYYRQKLDKVTADPLETDRMSTDNFRAVLMAGTTMSAEEVDTVMEAVTRLAEATGDSADTALAMAIHQLKTEAVITGSDGSLKSGANGAITNGVDIIIGSVRRTMKLATGKADVSTVLHEVFHAFRPYLSAEDQATLLAWSGQTEWNTLAEEFGARGLETHILESKKHGSAVDAILDKLATWFAIIYDVTMGPLQASDGMGGKHDVVLNESARKVYQKILAGKQVNEAPAFGMDQPMREDLFQIDAYHGTKLRGLGSLSTDFLKTGYGANTKGAGLYLTDEPGRAGQYSKTTDKAFKVDGKDWTPVGEVARILRAYEGDTKDAKASLRAYADKYADRPAAKPEDAIRALDAINRDALEITTGGQVYKVAIPSIGELMDWDKPYSQQLPEIKAGLDRLGTWRSDQTGEEIYRALVDKYKRKQAFRPEQAASRALALSDIKGHVYQDKVGANQGKDFKSYVVYQGQDTQIVGELFQDDLTPAPFETARFSEQVDQFISGDFSGDKKLQVGRTSKVLQLTGLKYLQVEMSQSAIEKAMGEEGQIKHGHGLTVEDIKAVLPGLFNPIAVFDSLTQPGTSMVVSGEVDHKMRPVVISVHPDRMAGRNLINEVMSVYGRDGFKDHWKAVSGGGLLYFDNENGPEWFQSIGLQSPKEETLKATNPRLKLKSELVNPQADLFQDSLDIDVLTAQIEAAKMTLARLDTKKETDLRINALASKKVLDKIGSTTTKADIERQFNIEKDRLRQAIEDDQAALEILRQSAASQVPKEDRERVIVEQAVASGLMVPTSSILPFASQQWAADELARRDSLKELTEESLKYDTPEEFIKAAEADRAIMSGEFDPFADTATDVTPFTPDEEKVYRQAYLAARMKTPAEFDKAFVDSLDDAKAIEILAKIGADPALMAKDNLPRHVTAQALKAANGGEVAPKELKSIITTMKNKPRPYRQQAWAWSKGGDRDELLVEALAVEAFMEAKAREMEPPEVSLTSLEFPSDLTIKMQAELLTANRSKSAWQRSALDAESEAKNLDHALSAVERLTQKWADANEKAKAEEDAVQALGKVAGTYLQRVQGLLSRLKTRAEGVDSHTEARVVADFTDVAREIKAAMRAKDAEKKATRAKFQRMRDMAKYIAQAVPKTIHVDYARQIERMRVMVDPHFRRDDKLKLRQARAEFYAQNPDILATLKDRDQKDVFAVSLNLMDESDLENLYLERRALEDMGREKLRAKMANRQERIEGLKARVYGAVYKEWRDLNQARAEAEAKGDTTTASDLAQKILTWETQKAQEMTNHGIADDKRGKGGEIQALIFTIGNVADILDGGQDYKGPNVELLWKTPNQAENEFLDQKLRRVDAMFAWLKENKVPVRDLFKRVTVEGTGTTWTVDALMDMYIGMKNEKKAAAIRYGNRVDPKVIRFAQESPDLAWMRQLGDKILAEYEDNQERLFQAIRDFQNIDPVYEKYYSPISRSEIDMEAMDEQIKYEQGLATAVRAASVEKGFTISRIDIPEEFQKPIKLGAWTAWLEQVTRQEQFVAYAPVIQDLKAVYHDGGVKSAISQTKGMGYYREIDNYINVLANRYWGKSFTFFDKIMGKLQSNAAIAFMSYNLSTALKQIPALATFIGHANPLHLIKSAVMLPKVLKTANEKSAQIRGRVEKFGFIRIDQGKRKSAAGRWMYEVAHLGMVPMQIVDKLTTVIGWNACYETAIGQGKTEEAAIEYADWVVDQTQQANHPKATAGAYRNQNALLRTLLMFTGPSNKIFNQLTYGNLQAIQQGHVLKSAAITMGIGVSMLAFWSIGHGGPPEDETEWMQALGAGSVELLPIIGPSIAALIRGYNQGQAPAQQVLQTSSEAIIATGRAADDSKSDEYRNKQMWKAIASGLEAVGLSGGVPVTEPIRIFRAIGNGNAGELLGWRKKEQ